jgi:hypothetical protein
VKGSTAEVGARASGLDLLALTPRASAGAVECVVLVLVVLPRVLVLGGWWCWWCCCCCWCWCCRRCNRL